MYLFKYIIEIFLCFPKIWLWTNSFLNDILKRTLPKLESSETTAVAVDEIYTALSQDDNGKIPSKFVASSLLHTLISTL